MRVPFVDLARTNVAMADRLTSAFTRVLHSGRYLMGPEVERFEKYVARWYGIPHAIACSSGTDACGLAIRATYPDGVRIATPAFGAVPTISAIEAAGAIPVLVDVDPVTRGVSFDTLAQVRTDAAIVVHMFGQMCDVPPTAIEDCAHAQGAARWMDGVLVEAGALGRAAALSWFPTKCLGSLGDGGAVITNDPGIAARVRALRHYGGLLDGDVTMRGQNSRLSELNAALLAEKLPHLTDWNARRRLIADRYRHELRGRVTVPRPRDGESPSYHVFVIEHPERDRIRAALEERGVSSMIHYARPLHFYRRWNHLGAPGDFPVSERLAATVLSLPCFPGMRDDEQDAVIAAAKEVT